MELPITWASLTEERRVLLRETAARGNHSYVYVPLPEKVARFGGHPSKLRAFRMWLLFPCQIRYDVFPICFQARTRTDVNLFHSLGGKANAALHIMHGLLLS